jgi:hypothetical protein
MLFDDEVTQKLADLAAAAGANSDSAEQDGEAFGGDFVPDPIGAIYAGCAALRTIRDTVGTTTPDGGRHGCSHDQRFALASVLRKLPGGREEIHRLLGKCSDYDRAVTDSQIDSISYPPITCQTLRKKKICRKLCEEIKARGGKSPVAFAHQQRISAIDFEVSSVVVYDSIPPVYELSVDEGLLRLTSERLISIKRFKLAFVETFHRVPQMPGGKGAAEVWDTIVNGWLARAEKVHQPDDASELVVVREQISTMIARLPEGESPDDLDDGRAFRDEQGRRLIKSTPLLKPLKDLGVELAAHDLCQHLRALGFTDESPHLGPEKKTYRVWVAPDQLPTPEGGE